jgi:hypothetical protein
MTVRIIHAFLRHVLDVLLPGTGSRRAGTSPAAPAPARRPQAPRSTPPWPPAPRSPYGIDVPLDGHAAALVRPYVLASERERARRYRRRVALVLAADWGIDLDRHVVGVKEAA